MSMGMARKIQRGQVISGGGTCGGPRRYGRNRACWIGKVESSNFIYERDVHSGGMRCGSRWRGCRCGGLGTAKCLQTRGEDIVCTRTTGDTQGFCGRLWGWWESGGGLRWLRAGFAILQIWSAEFSKTGRHAKASAGADLREVSTFA